MFDTMTLTKIVGGLCGTLLVFLLAGWASESLYHIGGDHGGDAHAAQGYLIETGEDDSHGETETEELPFAEYLAAADPSKGEKVFRKCGACHKLAEGENATGPTLYGVVGRTVDAVPGFGYSGALEAVADVWSPDNLNAFLENPKGYAPGTAMSFSGLKKVEDRADLIAYLQTIGG